MKQIDCALQMLVQEGLAVASIARDDPSPLPSMHRDHNEPACTVTRLAVRTRIGRIVCVINLDRNLKHKLVIMRQCTSITDRQTDRQMDTDIVA